MKNLVILGAGTAGTMMANKLLRALPNDWRVTIVDRDDEHLYQPGLLFVPFGTYLPRELVRPRRSFLPKDARVHLSPISEIDPEARHVVTNDGRKLPYDVLIISTGCEIVPEKTEGLTGPGWKENAFDFYTLPGATALAQALTRFEQGRLVLNVAEMPIKCPVAPLEFLFLADDYFTRRGIREAVELVYATPLDGAFTKPRASELLGGLLEAKQIRVVPDFALETVDGSQRQIRSYDGRTEGYELLVSIPLHAGATFLRDGDLGDDLGFIPTDKHTLQTLRHPDIFALGDTTDLPSSKAGAVAHFQAEVLTDNVLRYIHDRPLAPEFDGHANCFIETGFGKAMLIDFNYDTEPLPGRFPLPGLGPFTLLEESHVNHWGKLAFKWVYWNKLLPGDDLPLDHRMLMAGKWR